MREKMASKIIVTIAYSLIVFYPAIYYAQSKNETEVRLRIQEYENAFNKGDAKSAAAIYDVNGTHTYANGITHIGRSEIEKGLMESLAGPMKGTQIKITPEVIRFPTNDIAIENASFLLSGIKMQDGTEIPPVKGLCLGVYHKKNNEWFAHAVQCMVPPPPQN
jgi:uncharacterized protein (TIGR02246 family)